MSTFVLKREYALAMPTSYIDIDRAEMEYVDGGIQFSRGYVAVVTDIIAMAFCPYLAPIKFMGKTAAKKLVSKYLPQIAGVFKKILTSALGIGINVSTGTIGKVVFGNLWCLTSIGGMVSLVADYATDGRINGVVRF